MPVALAINSKGHDVCVYDINPAVRGYLEDRVIPFREEGIQPLLDYHTVEWKSSIEEVVRSSEIVFLPIQTPHEPEFEGNDVLPDRRADFDYTWLKSALSDVAEACEKLQKRTILAVISTCLPGTFERELKPLLNEFVSYVYTPQFIAMGCVIQDYLYPEFNLIGVADPDAAETLEQFYATINAAPSVKTDITTAEGIKVAYNLQISAKIAIANAWGELSERLGMDFDAIKHSWELSTRRLVSTRYMDAGKSDSGGCHPRDLIAMSWLARESGMSHNLWEDLAIARQDYESWHADLAAKAAREHNLPLILLGRAFKPETDIETGSAAILMSNILRRNGVQHEHVNDLDFLPVAVYFISTKNSRYAEYMFPRGSVVLDPFGIIPDRDGVTVTRLGRR